MEKEGEMTNERDTRPGERELVFFQGHERKQGVMRRNNRKSLLGDKARIGSQTLDTDRQGGTEIVTCRENSY